MEKKRLYFVEESIFWIRVSEYVKRGEEVTVGYDGTLQLYYINEKI